MSKDIWIEITKGISVGKIEIELEGKWKAMSKTEIQEKLNEFINYFWKEGIIAV